MPSVTITNTKQKTNIEIPIPLVIFHPNIKMAKNTKTNIINNSAIEQIIPSDDTGTGLLKAKLYINQGKGRLKRQIISKISIAWFIQNANINGIKCMQLAYYFHFLSCCCMVAGHKLQQLLQQNCYYYSGSPENK